MEIELIKNSIHEIRGKKVILDFELAKMYQVETKYLKRTVKNNLKRFPSDFMFELSKDEWQNLRCKISTSSWGGQRYVPFAFTEQGIAMLSGLLNSEIAIAVNISIMRAFVMMRQWALNHQELSKRLDALEQQYGLKFSDIEQVLNFLIQKDK
ncbi:MAG: ORF6N domain-containing protein, partial [Flavobacteriia bacterium]|nr:ORF6N domain-containing protein [Flavobacteriia bacterium]